METIPLCVCLWLCREERMWLKERERENSIAITSLKSIWTDGYETHFSVLIQLILMTFILKNVMLSKPFLFLHLSYQHFIRTLPHRMHRIEINHFNGNPLLNIVDFDYLPRVWMCASAKTQCENWYERLLQSLNGIV